MSRMFQVPVAFKIKWLSKNGIVSQEQELWLPNLNNNIKKRP